MSMFQICQTLLHKVPAFEFSLPYYPSYDDSFHKILNDPSLMEPDWAVFELAHSRCSQIGIDHCRRRWQRSRSTKDTVHCVHRTHDNHESSPDDCVLMAVIDRIIAPAVDVVVAAGARKCPAASPSNHESFPATEIQCHHRHVQCFSVELAKMPKTAPDNWRLCERWDSIPSNDLHRSVDWRSGCDHRWPRLPSPSDFWGRHRNRKRNLNPNTNHFVRYF